MKSDGPYLIPEKNDMEKLCEMGRKLYPHFSQVYFRNRYLEAKKDNIHSYFIQCEKDDGALQIDWFEFLVRWIIPKVDKPMNTGWRALVTECKNPVEIVWEEFLRRK